jgi:hypothetical protein
MILDWTRTDLYIHHSSKALISGPTYWRRKEGKSTDRQRQRMAKLKSFTMPRRPTRTFDNEDE